MRIENISIIVIGVLSLILSLYTFTRGKNRAASRLYSSIIFFAGPIWSISIAMFRESTDVDLALFWNKLIYIVATIIPALVFTFSKLFPKRKKINPELLTIICVSMLFVLYELLFTDNFIKEVIINNTGNSIEIGFAYVIWLIWFCTLMPLSILGMFREYFTLKGPAKEQAKYIIIGASFPILGTAPTNAILPLLGIYQYIWIGPFFLMAMNTIVAYGLTRTRFISRKTLVKVVLENLIFGVTLYLSFYLIAHINILYTGNIFSTNSYLLGILITFFASPLLLGLVKGLDYFISSTVFKESINPVAIRDEFLRKSATELDIDKISDLYLSTINKTFKIAQGSVIMIDPIKKEMLFRKSNKMELPEMSDLVTLTKYFESPERETEIVILEEELFLLGEDEDYSNPNDKSEVLSIMKSHGIQMIIPTAKRIQYSGLFMLGESGDKIIPKVEELSLIQSISNSASIAIGRALLYKEVESFNETLKGKISDATTKLKEKNDQLQKLYDDLESLYQKEKDLMDVAGHEIRTPASIIKTNLSLLRDHLKKKEKSGLDEKTRTYMKRLTESTERQIQIINSFLETTRIDNDHFVLQIDTFDLVELVDEAVKDSLPFAKEKNLKLIFNKPQNKVHADLDKVRIREVLDNLIGNAIKFTEKGYIEVSISSTKDSARVEVKDSGIGIEEKDQDKLFLKFSRINPYAGGGDSSLVRSGGTGLGLYVSKSIVEEHGGKIGVKSEKNEGSTFFFEIPLSRNKTVYKG
ncbi:MAG: ATP-binding protein [bacterium]